MPPKKPKKPKSQDRHQSGFMVRLPEVHRTMLEQLRQKHRRPYTEEVQMALEEYYQRQGMTFPPATST